MFEKEEFSDWFKENTPKEGLSENTTFTKQFVIDAWNNGYNKAKKEMQEQGLALQSDMDKTIEQNIALKEQIEKMKCCENCAKNGHICVAEEMQGKLCGKNKVKWQLRR